MNNTSLTKIYHILSYHYRTLITFQQMLYIIRWRHTRIKFWRHTTKKNISLFYFYQSTRYQILFLLLFSWFSFICPLRYFPLRFLIYYLRISLLFYFSSPFFILSVYLNYWFLSIIRFFILFHAFMHSRHPFFFRQVCFTSTSTPSFAMWQLI